ncbi:hypothetical protein REPUB_Repub03eG0127500 [Reevesia pubescens]
MENLRSQKMARQETQELYQCHVLKKHEQTTEKSENEKNVVGVQKKTKPTNQNNKKFLNNVLDYLKSDSYLFAPLIPPPVLSGVKLKEPIKENQKRVLKKVGKYMKSDTYKYAPLISSQLIGSPPSGSGQFRCIRKVTVEVSTTMLNLKENHQSTESANAIAEKQPCKDSCPGMSTSDNQTVGHGKMVKHMVHQHCRSSSVSVQMTRFLGLSSRQAMGDLKLRKLVVE